MQPGVVGRRGPEADQHPKVLPESHRCIPGAVCLPLHLWGLFPLVLTLGIFGRLLVSQCQQFLDLFNGPRFRLNIAYFNAKLSTLPSSKPSTNRTNNSRSKDLRHYRELA